MSLKGYQWLVDNKVVMTYIFKDLTLNVLEDVPITELEDFKAYLEKQGEDIKRIKVKIHKNKKEE